MTYGLTYEVVIYEGNIILRLKIVVQYDYQLDSAHQNKLSWGVVYLKNKLSEEGREFAKKKLGISKAKSRNRCKNCYYHPYNYICNKHHIKTNNDETCVHYKKDTKFRFTSGGSMSPK